MIFKDYVARMSLMLFVTRNLEEEEFIFSMWYTSHMVGKFRRSEILSAEDFRAAVEEFLKMAIPEN